jgi:hypothetical protein
MAVTTGSAGISATPATDLYNLLATAMTGNGNWTQQSDSPVALATAGTTADVRVWKCTGGAAAFYVFFEVDDANTRIRVRMSEFWDTTAHQLKQPAGGGTVVGALDTTGVTPTANGTVTDTLTNIGSNNPQVAWSQITVLGTAYNYLYEVRDNLITFATRVAGANTYAIAGNFTSTVQALTDSFPIILLGHAGTGLNNTSGSSQASNSGRFTRLPGFGASSVTGGFAAFVYPLLHAGFNGGGGSVADAFSSLAGVATNPWFTNPLVSPILIHGAQQNSVGARRGFRGTLPNFVIGYYTTEPAVVTDTISISGVTYYPLGRAYTSSQQMYIAIKA